MVKVLKILLILAVMLSSFSLANASLAAEGDQNLPTFLVNGHDVGNTPDLWTDPKLDRKYSEGVVRGLRIDGTVRSAIISFIGLDPNETYYVCGQRDQKKCTSAGADGVGKRMRSNEQGEIHIKVCGGGIEQEGTWLKGKKIVSLTNESYVTGGQEDWIEDRSGCDEKDYFHEGEIYRLGLFHDKDAKAPINEGVAEIFIRHSYPVVKLSPSSGGKFSSLGTMIVELWGKRPGGDDDNNYVALLEGTNNGISIKKCLTVKGTGVTEPTREAGKQDETVGINTQALPTDDVATIEKFLLSGTGHGNVAASGNEGKVEMKRGSNGGIGNGSFVLKIMERKHDNRPLGSVFGKNITNSCTGGHTYMDIYFAISKTDANGLEIIKVIYDPEQADLEDITEGLLDRDFDSPPPPCADPNAFKDGKNECTAIDTAIGKIYTTPQGFIGSLFSFVLVLAAFGGVIVIIYSGYLLMISRGDKEKISAARETITSAILGLLFIVFSIVIIEIIGVDILQIPFFNR